MTKTTLFVVLAWIRLAVSLTLASAIVWGYMTYQASIGTFLSAVETSVSEMSTVVERTAETVEGGMEMLNEAQKQIVFSRGIVIQLKSVVEKQINDAPKYADGVMKTAEFLNNLAAPLQAFGEITTSISIPSSIKFDGGKLIVIMTTPYSDQGKQLKAAAQGVKDANEQLKKISNAIRQNAPIANSEVISSSKEIIKFLDNTEKNLSVLKAKGLPKAVVNLKMASQNLLSIRAQIGTINHLSEVVLIAGLLVALWGALHSIGAILLANFITKGLISDKASVIVQA